MLWVLSALPPNTWRVELTCKDNEGVVCQTQSCLGFCLKIGGPTIGKHVLEAPNKSRGLLVLLNRSLTYPPDMRSASINR